MKALLISIKPKYVTKILNGKKTIEVRRKFPKDYKGWVYIYCTKDKSNLEMMKTDLSNGTTESTILNGKVVARFYCDKLEEIKNNLAMRFFTESANEKELLEKSCLNSDQLFWYLAPQELKVKCCGYAIHISNLEIFDKPKELGEFKHPKPSICGVKDDKGLYQCDKCKYGYSEFMSCECRLPLTKAPQSFMYIEVDE